MQKSNTVHTEIRKSASSDVKSSHRLVSCSVLGIFASLMAKNLTFACLNFLIHIDLDMDANPFPLEDRPVRS
jgi:hypothetical protein